MTIETSSIGDHALGVRVRGISADSLKDDGVRLILRGLLAQRGLIVLEGVEPSHRLQVSVGEVFGTVMDYPAGRRGKIGDEEMPGIGEMVSGPDNCTVVEVAGERLSGWMPWHFDQCYRESPNIARVLRCAQQMPAGGMTGFLDGVELYQKFDPEIRRQIETCSVTYALNLALENLRFGVPAGFCIVRKPQAAAPADSGADLETAAHRAVRTSPTGHKVLLVSQWMATGIAGHADESGDALLEVVVQEILALSRSLAYFHRWQLSDMLVWDNLRMLHSSSGIDPAFSRIMYRTTIRAN
jgi:alpha-ketoglutarate-dependent taurine dioxygenase